MLNSLAVWAFGEWTSHHVAGLRHLNMTLARHRWLAGKVITADIGAALFEGMSTALLFVAAHQLMASERAGGGAGDAAVDWIMAVMHGYLSPQQALVFLLVLVILTQFLRSGLAFASLAFSARLRVLARQDIYDLVLRHILDLDFSQVSRKSSGEFITYFNVAKHFDNFIDTSNSVIRTIFLSLAYIAVLLWVAWDVTLIAIVALIPVSLGLKHIVRLIHNASHDLLNATIEMNSRALEFFSGIRLIRTFAREEGSLAHLTQSIRKGLEATRQGLVYRAAVNPIVDVVIVSLLALILLVAIMLLGNELGAGLPRLLVFLYTMYRLLPRVAALNGYWASYTRIWPNIVFTMKFLAETGTKPRVSGGLAFPGLRHAIEFQDVSLRYVKGEHPALENVSFVVPRGSIVALVGESGAGKSSILDLLLGLYRPDSGKILIDDVDLGEIDERSWRGRIGTVSQETFLFNASIRDNIAFANPEASEAVVIEAAKKAHAHEFICALADGYDTVIGERGYRLSGGQNQRLAITRALLRDPEILILDEATSELDSESERLIQTVLSEYRGTHTMIAIAHRLSTITAADRIIVLSRGAVAETGRHEELLAQGGLYARLWDIQSKAR